ncbi:MAG TPA: hypothetical protein VGE89_13760 [Bryobacteraceae bacterium]|jgi:hypothetical protein
MREPRLGDDIDDYCVRCKRIMNHSVVSVINAEPAKVRCRICHSDHDFRHEQAPPPKVDARKQALFNEVLKKANPQAAEAVVAVEEPPVELPEAASVAAVVVEKPKAKPVAQPAAEPKPKFKPKTAAKVKAKAKARK